MIDVKWQPTERDLRIFSILWLVFFGILGTIAFWRGAVTGASILWAFGWVFGLLGLARPRAMRLLYVLWMGIAFPIDMVLSYVFMGAIFYLILTPTGLLMRLFGRDPMTRRIDRAAASYWVPHRHPDSLSRYFKGY